MQYMFDRLAKIKQAQTAQQSVPIALPPLVSMLYPLWTQTT